MSKKTAILVGEGFPYSSLIAGFFYCSFQHSTQNLGELLRSKFLKWIVFKAILVKMACKKVFFLHLFTEKGPRKKDTFLGIALNGKGTFCLHML